MGREKFHYIDYSDINKFERAETGRIELKSYTDDLVLYSNFDSSLNATYAVSDVNSEVTGSPVTQNHGVFGQFLDFTDGGVVKYKSINFDELEDEGSVKFRIKPLFTKGYGYQDFLANTVTPTTADYKCRIYVNSTLINGTDISVSLTTGDTMGNVRNALHAEIMGKGATTALLDEGNIRVRATTYGDSILITNPGSGNSLLTLLGGVDTPKLPNPPSVDTNIFQIYNESGDSNRVILAHDTDSHILLKMYNNAGSLIVDEDLGLWNIHQNIWYTFELDWNKTLYQFWLDGELFSMDQTGFTRGGGGKAILQATSTDPYGIDEFIIYDEYQNSSSYTVETTALNKYPTDDPYIDIYFETGFKDESVKDLDLSCSTNCHFVVKIGNTWYYYYSGAWRQSDGSYAQSVTSSIMETKFAELTFIEDAELIIRVYFHSDGTTLQYIDDIKIVYTIGDTEPATLTGLVELDIPVNLITYFNIYIKTDQGEGTVDCSSESAIPGSITLEEIKDAINAANILGLNTASNDTHNRLLLQTTSVGSSAYLEVTNAETNDALSLIWGNTSSSYGVDASEGFPDYSNLYTWMRTRLGEPTIPCELTDQQFDNAIEEAVYWFNYYMNKDEEVEYTSLIGNGIDGYEIPSAVDADNILEIVMRPRFPYRYYSQDQHLLHNLWVQYMFRGGVSSGYFDFLSDYYITLNAEKDISIILGTETRWEVRWVGNSKRLFIHPTPEEMSVAIRYKKTITPAEIVNDNWIRRYSLAEAKLILGNIRSTFKSGVPGGTEMIQLNGEDLITQGQQEKEALLTEIKSRQEPIMFTWG